eukprot:scaffold379263_cov24-Prasinocladus_malaysianus.AAC.2
MRALTPFRIASSAAEETADRLLVCTAELLGAEIAQPLQHRSADACRPLIRYLGPFQTQVNSMYIARGTLTQSDWSVEACIE